MTDGQQSPTTDTFKARLTLDLEVDALAWMAHWAPDEPRPTVATISAYLVELVSISSASNAEALALTFIDGHQVPMDAHLEDCRTMGVHLYQHEQPTHGFYNCPAGGAR